MNAEESKKMVIEKSTDTIRRGSSLGYLSRGAKAEKRKGAFYLFSSAPSNSRNQGNTESRKKPEPARVRRGCKRGYCRRARARLNYTSPRGKSRRRLYDFYNGIIPSRRMLASNEVHIPAARTRARACGSPPPASV